MAIKQILSSTIPKAKNDLTGASKPSGSTISTPWSNLPNQPNSFFNPIPIDGSRWDKMYPYFLIVVQQDPKSGVYSPLSASQGTANVNIKLDPLKIVFEPMGNQWIYRLPITPQQLSITTEYATNIVATQTGVVEQHGGVRFKQISCAGSFGVWPNRGNINQEASNVSNKTSNNFFSKMINFVISGTQTQNALGALQEQRNRLRNILSGGYPVKPPPKINVERDGIGGFEGTGYAQALLLDQFLEQFYELKRQSKNSNLRLAFFMPKQNQAFLVSVRPFNYMQSADSPHEFRYSFQMLAYKRISINSSDTVQSVPIPTLNTSSLQKKLNNVLELRRTLSKYINLVRAVRSDANTVFNILRQVTVFYKNLLGAVATTVDLPVNVITDAKLAIADSMLNLLQAGAQAGAIAAFLGGNKNTLKNLKKGIENVPFGQANNDQNTSLIASSFSFKTSPINEIFNDPNANFDILNSINVDQINLPQSILDLIQLEQEQISLFTPADFLSQQAVLKELALQISNEFGTGDEDFSFFYKKPPPKVKLQPITLDNYDILKKLYDVIQDYSTLILNESVIEAQNQAFEFVKAEARAANIPFEDANSKIKLPVPFGLTLEQIANRYLGNPERWIEIATLNGLKSPYIDEDGFFKSFLSNGSGRQFNIDSNANLFIGQTIYLKSNTQPIDKRTIINIEKINDTNFLITVDGLDNLSIYTTADNAKMQAFLPGTVNSRGFIFIPTPEPVSDDFVIRPLPVAKEDELVGISKVDLLLNEDNDIAIDGQGELKLSFGLQNLFQSLKLKFITDLGSLLRFPFFGLGLRSGISTADISANEIFDTVNKLIRADDRFEGIEQMQVDLKGPFLDISLTVRLRSGRGLVPLNFKVKL